MYEMLVQNFFVEIIIIVPGKAEAAYVDSFGHGSTYVVVDKGVATFAQ